ncbi:MAG: prolyl oligopeptidase family serine peptidase [Ectothiorhodospiraceae bacterium]|nr:prolyl oligopeptidase family serine peptidase [Ectothiorhodospiraceae bacterium]
MTAAIRRSPPGLPPAALADAPVTGVPQIGPNGIAWTELDPRNHGRTGVWLLPRGGQQPHRLVPEQRSVRSRVHQYGGGALWPGAGSYHWYFVDDADQSLWGIPADGGEPRLLLPGDPGTPIGDGHVSACGKRLVLLREEPARGRTTVIMLQPDAPNGIRLLDGRSSFCGAPRLSPDGRHAAWLSWKDGCMPWEHSRVHWMRLENGERMVAGDAEASLLEPRWSDNGTLYCLSDRTGAWAPARVTRAGIRPLLRSRDDMARPPWQLGNSHYALLPDGGMAAIRIRNAGCELVRISPDGETTPIPGPENDLEGLQTDGWHAICLAGTPDSSRHMLQVDMRTGERRALTSGHSVALPDARISRAEDVSVGTRRGRVYGFLYPPAPPLDGKPPPLLVRAHGGPTAMRRAVHAPDTQFWTSNGLAVLDVNYSGSSGHGRRYRERLRGQWGRADRDDCIALAQAVAATGRADPRRMVITGSSAGGLTVLNALIRGVFRGGTSRYGVTDLELLAASTHRFEAGYLTFLLGPLPESRHTYRRRSPVHQARHLRGAVLLLQGEDDPVVPVEQARRIHTALGGANGSARLVVYPGEQHGFRQGEHLEDSYARELAFYRDLLAL